MKMPKKYITIKMPVDEIDFFGAVLNCAVRYCIGRRTYMPGLVTDWIMNHCHGILNQKTIGVMKRDIDEARTRPFDGLGDNCDIITWLKFREWLDKEGTDNA
jgi:hypothetical protein